MSESWTPAEKKVARTAFDRAATQAEREFLKKHADFNPRSLEELWSLELKIREWRKD